MTNKKVYIVAHRGASDEAPENTIPSFKKAFLEGADFIEGDFWLTKDNHIVCIHDSNTKRTSKVGTKLYITKTKLSELRSVDVGNWKNPQFEGTYIPTLEEIIEIIPDDRGIFIEIKDDRKEFLLKLSDVLRNKKLSNDQIRIIAFNPNTIIASKKLFPDIKVYWLFEWFSSKRKCLNGIAHQRLLYTLKKLNCDGVDLNNASYINEKLSVYLKDNGYELCVYDVEKGEDAVRLTKLGVDYITTNSPAKIIDQLNRYIADQNV
ncbi:glycerophosphodiester phosphodiesterase family protein [Melioribacter sp. OK-6-Me]|uniref:glycerophosphodiester phosphodiesterase family protein n=1 Tax=unclassified Melioribacter TaxID=2627329 RepID=UPI003ED90706